MKRENDKITVHQELALLSPELASLRKEEDPFKVPDGYFEHMTAEVLSKVGEEPAADRQKVVYLSKRRHIWQVAAAMLVLLAAGIWVYNSPSSPLTQTESLQIADLSDEEIVDYLELNIEEVTFSQLADASTLDEVTWNLGEEEIDSYLEDYFDALEDLDEDIDL